MSTTTIIVLVSVIMIVIIAVGFSLTQRLKKRIDADVPHRVGPPVALTVSAESAARVARLSTEPIFVRQAPDGTRVQIENRPMVPLVMLTDGEAVLGLREVTMAAANRFGATWTGLVTTDDQGVVSVQRLS